MALLAGYNKDVRLSNVFISEERIKEVLESPHASNLPCPDESHPQSRLRIIFVASRVFMRAQIQILIDLERLKPVLADKGFQEEISFSTDASGDHVVTLLRKDIAGALRDAMAEAMAEDLDAVPGAGFEMVNADREIPSLPNPPAGLLTRMGSAVKGMFG